MRSRLRFVILVLAVALAVALAGCSSGAHHESAQRSESRRQQRSYQDLAAAQPAHGMNYSPTRNTINTWVDTWTVRGQLAFTYILNQQGEPVGYYVFEGPPVSYCASLTPTYKLVDPGGSSDNGNISVPAPSLDGVYYSGGQCIQYYGKDALTGRLLEFTAGGALNFINSTQPLAITAPPLGITRLDQVHPNAQGQYLKP